MQAMGGSQPITVATPYRLEPIATDSQGIANCPAGSAGWIRNVTNLVQYSNCSAFAFAGLTAPDLLIIGSRHDLGGGTATGSATTTGDGSFSPDTYSVCSTARPQSTGETDALQSWTLNGSPLPHSNSVVYKYTNALQFRSTDIRRCQRTFNSEYCRYLPSYVSPRQR
jgi:hypothetical protein